MEKKTNPELSDIIKIQYTNNFFGLKIEILITNNVGPVFYITQAQKS